MLSCVITQTGSKSVEVTLRQHSMGFVGFMSLTGNERFPNQVSVVNMEWFDFILRFYMGEQWRYRIPGSRLGETHIYYINYGIQQREKMSSSGGSRFVLSRR